MDTNVFRILFLTGAIVFSSVSSFGAEAIYLKPLGTGETRATVDGASWATAHTNVKEAITAAATASKPVYAAQGVYIITAQIALPTGVALYGGFPGVDDAETLDDRDWDTYETIFTGDADQSTTWMHAVPSLGTCTASSRSGTGKRVIQDGKVFLPAYTGDYDAYYPSYDYNHTSYATQCFSVGSGVSGTVDGIWIVSFHRQGPYNSNGAAFTINASCGAFTIRNCRLVANSAVTGVINGGGSNLLIADCKFLNNSCLTRGAALYTEGGPTVRNCEFCGGVRMDESNENGSANIGMLIGVSSYTTPCPVKLNFSNCVFSRASAFQKNSYQEGKGAALITGGSETLYGAKMHFTDCVFSNNFACSGLAQSSGKATGMPLLNAQDADFTRCLFAQNRQGFTVVAGQTYCMIKGCLDKDWQQDFDGCTFLSNTVFTVLSSSSGGGDVCRRHRWQSSAICAKVHLRQYDVLR